MSLDQLVESMYQRSVKPVEGGQSHQPHKRSFFAFLKSFFFSKPRVIAGEVKQSQEIAMSSSSSRDDRERSFTSFRMTLPRPIKLVIKPFVFLLKPLDVILTPVVVTLNLIQGLLPSSWVKKMRLQNKLLYYTILLVIFGVFGGLAYFQFFHPKEILAAWFNDNWLYRKEIPVTAHTSAETNVYLNLTGAAALDTSDTTKFQADCGDLRFTDSGGNLLSYFIVSGCGTSTTVVHVLVPDFPAGSQTFYYYYGNPQAVNGFSASDFATQATGETIGTIGSEEKGPAPIHYWSFDDGAGPNASDSAGLRSTVGLYNGPTWQKEDLCIIEKCLLFDGTDDFGQVPNPQLPTNDFTYTAWVNLNANTDETLFMASKTGGDEFRVHVNSNSNVELYTNNGLRVTSAGTVPTSTWTFIAVSSSSGTLRVYLNGKQDANTGSNTTQMTFGSCPLFIGADVDTNCSQGVANYLKGKIDDVKIYNFALSADQVKTNYAARGSRTGSSSVFGIQDQSYLTEGLVGYWKMDETTANTCSGGEDSCDSSGNSLNGVWNGGATASQAAKFASGAIFNAAGTDYVEVARNTLLMPNKITASIWVNTTTLTNGPLMGLGSGNFGYIMTAGTDGFVRFTVAINGTAQTVAFSGYTDGLWHHVVGTYDEEYLRIYKDGVLQSSSYLPGTITHTVSGSQNFRFGAEVAGCSCFTGALDEARLYQRALSSSEVVKLYNFAPGPKSYWDFEEGGGSELRDRRGNKNGNWTAAAWAAGKYGKAGSFNGTTSDVNMGDTPLLEPGLGHWSYCFWIKTSSDQQGFIFGENQFSFNSWGVFMTTTGVLRFDAKMTNPPGTLFRRDSIKVINDGKWHNACITYDRFENTTLYIDGVVDSRLNVSAAKDQSFDGADSFHIGNQAAIGFFSGLIDEARYYDYILTQEQVTAQMNAEHPIVGSPISSALGHWKFDDGYGNVASNSGSLGGGANGVMYNFPVVSQVESGWSNNGKVKKALNFDGSNDYVNFGSHPAFDNMSQLSVSAWINPRFSAGTIMSKFGRYLVNEEGGWWIYFENEVYNFLVDRASGQYSCSTVVVPYEDFKWVHFAFTWDGNMNGDDTEGSFYINGKQVSSTCSAIGSGRVDDAAQDLLTGMTENQMYKSEGLLDELKIYNYPLTDQQVKLDYNQGSSLVLGSFGMNSSGVASNSASAVYCVPGDTTQACSPVGEWRFEEKSGGMANDTSSNGFNGTLTNKPPRVRGKVGGALSFDGSLSGGSATYVDVGDKTQFELTTFTISAWVYRNGACGTFLDCTIFAKGTSGSVGYSFNVNTPNCGNYQVALNIKDTQFVCGTTVIQPNRWYHLAASIDGSTVKVYVNGVLENSAAQTQTPTFSTETAKIGNRNTNLDLGFSGYIDEVKLYNYAMSAAQISWDYNHGKPVGYWKLDECSGTNANDSSGNGNRGIISAGIAGETSIGDCETSSTMWGEGAIGKYNYSLDFDNTDDAVYASMSASLNNIPSNGAGMSLSVWINADSIGENSLGRIFDKVDPSGVNGWLLFFNGNNTRLEFKAFMSGTARDVITVDRPIELGSWYHVAFVWNFTGTCPGAGTFYINGKVVSNLTDTSCTGTYRSDAGNFLYIGNSPNLNRTFDGQIDEAQVFNYPLTAVQVKNLYNQSAAVRFGPAQGAP